MLVTLVVTAVNDRQSAAPPPRPTRAGNTGCAIESISVQPTTVSLGKQAPGTSDIVLQGNMAPFAENPPLEQASYTG